MSSSAEFLMALFSLYHEYPQTRAEFRCLAPLWDQARSRPWPRRWYVPQAPYLDHAADWCRKGAEHWDVYVGVLPRTGHRGTQHDVHWGALLFADVDGGADGLDGAVSRVLSADVPRPHMAVASGPCGLHAYWRLARAVPLADNGARSLYKSLLRRLSQAIGGEAPGAHADLSACEPARVLRVPDTQNHKRQGQPVPVRLLHCDVSGTPMSYHDWMHYLPQEKFFSMGKPAPVHYHGYTSSGFITPGLVDWSRRGYPEGKRHQDLAGAAAFLKRDCHLGEDDALALMVNKAAASPGLRAIPMRELEEMVRWA